MGKGKGNVEPMSEGEFAQDENVERGNWTGKMDFLLSAIGFAVGLGNVWRFPYIAYKSGGAVFLIPYIVMLVFAGLPLFFMEMAFGQFSSQGPITVWRAAPIFAGVGWAMVMISALVCIYYNMIIAYTIYYLFASFTSELPWQKCQERWGPTCQERTGVNRTILNMTKMWCQELKDMNDTMGMDYKNNCTLTKKSPSELFWERDVLDMSEGIDDGASEFRWQLILCLLLAWVIVFLCMIKGIKSSGKVVYVTATFPYIVLVILLIRNATLPGAIDGITFYIVPKWEYLGKASVWYGAASQIFYSLGVAFGGLLTMASYNRFQNHVYRDAILVAIINCATSLFAGFVIFAAMGFMSHETGLPVDKVAASGPGLAFIAYPEGISMMPVAPLWSILFFVMLLTLGLDSQFAMMETVISAFVDLFPWLREGKRKILFTLFVSIFLFLCGLPQCTRAGLYVMELFNWYSAGYSLMFTALIEIIGVAYVYGFKNFSEDIQLMLGFKPNIYWLATWLVITPGLLTFILIFSSVTYSPATLNDYTYPPWANYIGFGMVAAAVILIPIAALVALMKRGTNAWKPTDDWGPAVDKFRTGKYAPRGFSDISNSNPGYIKDQQF